MRQRGFPQRDGKAPPLDELVELALGELHRRFSQLDEKALPLGSLASSL
jgi:hypothetical protein